MLPTSADRIPRIATIAWAMLLLMSVVGSGAARALHERLDHHSLAAAWAVHDADGDAATPPTPTPSPSPAPHVHLHADCQTCAMLAAALDGLIVLFAALLIGVAPSSRSPARIGRAAARATFRAATPHTGPPAFALA